MAAVTSGVNFNATTNAASYTTASFTPAAGDLLVVTVGIANAAHADATLASSVAGQSFTLVDRITTGTLNTAFVFVANELSTAVAQTVTYSNGGATANGGHIQVNRVSGMARVGAAAIRQSAVHTLAANGTVTLSFPSAFLTANAGIIVTANGGTAPAGPAGWTSLQSLAFTSPTVRTNTWRRDSGETLDVISYTSSSAASTVGVELDISAAGGGGGGTVVEAVGSAAGAASVTGASARHLAGAGGAAGVAAVTGDAGRTQAGAGDAAGVATVSGVGEAVLPGGGTSGTTGWMQHTSVSSPSGDGQWVDLANLGSLDGVHASSTISGAGNHKLLRLVWSPAIPAGATITGIEVRWFGAPRSPAGTYGGFNSIVTYNNLSSYAASRGFNNYSGDGYHQGVGGPADTWGRVWTPEEINSGGLGVDLDWVATAACTIYLDHAQMRVNFTTAGGGPTVVEGAGGAVGVAAVTGEAGRIQAGVADSAGAASVIGHAAYRLAAAGGATGASVTTGAGGRIVGATAASIAAASVTGLAAAARAASGSSLGSAAVTGAGGRLSAAAAAAAGAGTVTGAGGRTVAAAGTSAGAGAVAAVGGRIVGAVGGAAGGSTVTGESGSPSSGSEGSSTGTATVTGSGGRIVSADGSAAGGSTVTGAGARRLGGAGSAAGGSTVTGAGARRLGGAGSAAGVASASGSAAWRQAGAGSAAGTSIVTGQTDAGGSFVVAADGSAIGAATVAAAGAALRTAAGASTGSATVTGAAGRIVSAAGAASGSSSGVAYAARFLGAAGSAAGSASAFGFAAFTYTAAGNTEGTATVTGDSGAGLVPVTHGAVGGRPSRLSPVRIASVFVADRSARYSPSRAAVISAGIRRPNLQTRSR